MAPATLRALLASAIDYAGLFPPASLSLATVARNFAAYRLSSHAWALGRLVVPAARLEELAGILREQGGSARPTPVAALIGGNAADDADLVRAQNSAANPVVLVESMEVRVDSVDEVTSTLRALDRSIPTYVEVPVRNDPLPFLQALAPLGARAKIRTGGTTPDAFPTASEIARFFSRCAELEVCCKATAGLHHPMRGEHRLTYDADAPRAPMYGFLNVMLAATLARNGASAAVVEAVLEERDTGRMVFSDDAVVCLDETVSLANVADARRNFMAGFGSCSFHEPIDDLHHLSYL